MTHSLLRSSSTHEPSDPPLRVIQILVYFITSHFCLLKEIKNTPFYWHISIPSIKYFLYLKNVAKCLSFTQSVKIRFLT